MELKEFIKKETIVAMKNKTKARLSLLRLISTFITNKEIELGIKGKENLNDAEVINILKSMIKSRENVIADYEKISDKESIAKEKEEISIINEFLPTPYTEEETKNIVYNIMQEVNVSSIKDMKIIMQNLNAREDISKFNKSLVAKIIKDKLEN